MILTPELIAEGRRNFLAAVASTPTMQARGRPTPPLPGGPLRAALIGTGAQGTVLAGQVDPGFLTLQALCDINPRRRGKVAASLIARGRPAPREYDDWRAMLAAEKLEAVLIASPLWCHAEMAVACLQAGLHVFCEKMMAYDVDGCRQMREAAQRADRVLEVGHHRHAAWHYRAAFEGLIQPRRLGDLWHVRTGVHRNRSWRRTEEAPGPGFDPTPWGYPTWDHLLNWRLYARYSRGHIGELASHQIGVANWYLGEAPSHVYAAGGINRFRDREVADHLFLTFEYPSGSTLVYSSIESNDFDATSEYFMGTQGTLITRDHDALYFPDVAGAPASATAPSPAAAPPPSRRSAAGTAAPPAALGAPAPAPANASMWADTLSGYRLELLAFCRAVRGHGPLSCGPEAAHHTAAAGVAAWDALKTMARVAVTQTT